MEEPRAALGRSGLDPGTEAEEDHVLNSRSASHIGVIGAALEPSFVSTTVVSAQRAGAHPGGSGVVGYRGPGSGDAEVEETLGLQLALARDALHLAVIELDGGGERDSVGQAARRARCVRDLLREAVVSLSRARLYRQDIFSFDIAVVYAEDISLGRELRRLRELLASLYWRNLSHLQIHGEIESRSSYLRAGSNDPRCRLGARGAIASRSASLSGGATPCEHDDVAVQRFVSQIELGRRHRLLRWCGLAAAVLVATVVAPTTVAAWVLPVATAAACVLHLWPARRRFGPEKEPLVLGLAPALPAAGP